MKATELQCGDIILVDGKPTRVYGVMERMNRIYDTMTNDISLKRCSGMPLTPEILEKNGFNRHGCISENEQYRVMIQHWSKDNLALNKVGKHGNPVFIPDLIYVHELQHALRLCGLDELADNFKV